MIHATIELPVQYHSTPANTNQSPTLTTYLLENFETLDPLRKRPLIIICPGGGYEHLSVREGEAVAIRMNSLGFQAAILNYSLAPMNFPAAICDAAEAVQYARQHAAQWYIDPDKIVLCGFSAGGHLAASLGCFWNRAPVITTQNSLFKDVSYKPAQIRPNAILLCYPVITSGEFCHERSIQNVLGTTTHIDRAFVSLEKQVTDDVPPVFMWHTNADETVSAENSLLFATALRQHHIPFEYHLFSCGVHGLGLATAETSVPSGRTIEPECAVWPELFATWFKELV
jgi:acetyl esterase/lipase